MQIAKCQKSLILSYIQFQEKTDEVTNKFLDKKRYVYQPKQPLATVNVDEGYTKSPKKRRHEEADVNLTEDEMSVNTINKYVKIHLNPISCNEKKKENLFVAYGKGI